MKRICSIIILCFLFKISYSLAPIVKTTYGLIQGVEDDLVYMYLGIPFAKPPINDLRWKNPVDMEKWSNIYDASSLKPACPQLNCSSRMPAESCPPNYSEDCLYLNIYVPKNLNESKAVMLFIHGGNYQYQGANSILFDGRRYSNFTDTILVNIQYRIGALGFLVTGKTSDQANGNYGILDQRMAIMWVKNNIFAFNGDPNRITLFGQSAGAESVSIHLLSEDMQDKFNNAIIQSSPMAIPFKNYEESLLLYNIFTQTLNCSIQDMKCLRSKSIDDILNAQIVAENKVSSVKLLEFFEAWLPWIDGKIIKGQLLDFPKWIKSANFQFKQFIIGTLVEECYIYINLAFPNLISLAEYTGLILGGFKQHSIDILLNYPPNLLANDQRDQLSVLATHWVFLCGSRRFLEQAINSNNSSLGYYQYVFDYSLDFAGWDNFTFCYNHSCHGSDMPYTFDSVDDYFTKDGKRLAKSHLTYWSNFAKTNKAGSSDGLEWNEYKLEKKSFLKFKKDFNDYGQDYKKKQCDFFDSIGYYY
ncbi:unnamed protein product [Brachionus calyciflorus]|uniref:Carboxylesterase type B domain-containing protein n=1 Tax=Brachionus calyciflorus TaxID=104777 RepID=A0A814CIR1_9BILA|nr:unnamed protein product [Brachionus calyciflorus]